MPNNTTKNSRITIEAELSKTLNISWADARDLASYARGKLGIVPGDKATEKARRESIIQSAIEANAQSPKKERTAKKKTKLSDEEKKRQDKIEKSGKKMESIWYETEFDGRHGCMF